MRRAVLQIITNPIMLAMSGVACLVGGALWPITASAAAVSGSSDDGMPTLLPWHFQSAAALFFVGAAVVWCGALCSKANQVGFILLFYSAAVLLNEQVCMNAVDANACAHTQACFQLIAHASMCAGGQGGREGRGQG